MLNEVTWLQRLPEDLRRYFPEVLATRVGLDWAEYDMPYSPWPNFAQLLVDGQISASSAIAAVQRILQFAFQCIYPRNNRPTPANFFRQNYLDKFRRRVAAAEGASTRFDRLLREPILIINGEPVENPQTLVQRIAGDDQLLARLKPPHLGMIHGDFKFDNFLIAPDESSFLLLDPRGATFCGEAEGDYLEDVAKLRTSSLGRYDLFRAGRLDLRVQGARIFCTLDASASSAAHVLSALDAAVMSGLPAWVAERSDPHWQLRLAFLTPLLLVANAPFQLAPVNEQTEAVAIALLATGAQQLQSAVDSLDRRCAH